jgi:hypothetical protein
MKIDRHRVTVPEPVRFRVQHKILHIDLPKLLQLIGDTTQQRGQIVLTRPIRVPEREMLGSPWLIGMTHNPILTRDSPAVPPIFRLRSTQVASWHPTREQPQRGRRSDRRDFRSRCNPRTQRPPAEQPSPMDEHPG